MNREQHVLYFNIICSNFPLVCRTMTLINFILLCTRNNNSLNTLSSIASHFISHFGLSCSLAEMRLAIRTSCIVLISNHIFISSICDRRTTYLNIPGFQWIFMNLGYGLIQNDANVVTLSSYNFTSSSERGRFPSLRHKRGIVSCIQALFENYFVPDGMQCLISRPSHTAFTLKLFRFNRFLVCLTL